MWIHIRNNFIQNRSTNIIKISERQVIRCFPLRPFSTQRNSLIYTLRRCLLQILREGGAFVIYCDVCTDAFKPATLLFGTSDGDDTLHVEHLLCILHDDIACCTCCTAHHKCVSGLNLERVDKAPVGGLARDTECTKEDAWA